MGSSRLPATLAKLIVFACLALAARPAAGAAISYQTTSDWETGFSGQITIQNDSAREIRDWTIAFEFDRVVSVVWDAEIVSHEGKRYVIQGAEWNSVIAPGQSVSFGFTGSPGLIQAGPRDFSLTEPSGEGRSAVPVPFRSRQRPRPADAETPPTGNPPSGLVVSIVQSSQWDEGFSANLIIVNGTSQVLNDWTLLLTLQPVITSIWNGSLTRDGSRYRITNAGWNGRIAPGESVTLGFNASGSLRESSVSDCAVNGLACSVVIETAGFIPPASAAIEIVGVDSEDKDALQVTIPQGPAQYELRMRNDAETTFNVLTNNPAVATAAVQGNTLTVTGRVSGRASVRIEDAVNGNLRFLGVRVRDSAGATPGMPDYLALGSVSEDLPEHLDFWRAFAAGPKNRRVDIRYIYINGGPFHGWNTWGSGEGSRAIHYIRNSRALGIIPYFVFYNIPEGSESFEVDKAHVQDPAYLEAYFKNLGLFLDIINEESPDDLVGVILEPDFLGYMAQNAGKPAAEIPAATSAAYKAGVLSREQDPAFADTIKGFVEAVNYVISKRTPQVYFGWQMNLWASPAGGFTTGIPNRGIIRKTDDVGVAEGRPLIAQEARAITRYYLAAGVASHGAHFLSIDKYGLDAVGFQSSAAANPADSVWFWNADHWNNYLAFVNAIHETSSLPVVLWQLPVGRVNSTLATNPYDESGRWPDLPNTHQRFEDSAPTFFLGDVFTTAGGRFQYFSANQGADPKVTVEGNRIRWQAHMEEAAEKGVAVILFGPGVGASTANLGNPPGDDYWWITKAQQYLDNPTPAKTAPR